KAGFVPDDPGSDAVRKFLGADEIAATDFQGIEAQRLGAEVHQTLGNEDRHRPADSAVRPGRRLASGNAAHRATIGADLVGTRQEADYLDRFQTTGPGIDRIG